MKRVIFLFFIFILWGNLKSQTIYCPPNIDFETGGYGYWKFETGSCCPIITSSSTQITNRHTLTSGTNIDFYGKFPILAPGGGSYSLKLGNNNIGSQAEKAKYYVRIPVGLNNYSLIYRFAVVFEDPDHLPSQQPRFEVKVIDSATNQVLPCNQYIYVAGSSLPGFFRSTVDYDVYYRPWYTASLDLSGYSGRTVIVSFASGDCDLGAHFGYGYVDVACSLFQIGSVFCAGKSTQTLKAPPGFQKYTWYNTNYSTIIDTGQNITIPTPTSASTFHVVLQPYTGFGCIDTLSTSFTLAYPSSDSIVDTVCDLSSKYKYKVSGIYYDTLVNAAGCDSIRILNLTVKKSSYYTITKTICIGDSFLGRNITGIYKDTFSNSVGCDSIRTLDLTVVLDNKSYINTSVCQGLGYAGYSQSGTYYDTFKKSGYCDSIRILNLTVNPPLRGTLYMSLCQGKSYLGKNTTGIYYDTTKTKEGCDSITEIQLTIEPYIRSFINPIICLGNSFAGYTNTGVYLDTFKNREGCDSILQTNLKVISPITINLDTASCDSFKFKKRLFFSNTVFIDTIRSIQGCDSIFNIYKLEIHKPIRVKNDSIENCFKYNFNGIDYFKDTLLKSNISKVVFPFCDSLLKNTVIKIFPLPIPKIYFVPDTIIKYNEKIKLSASGGVSYLWTWLNNSSSNQSIEHTMIEKTYFEVKVTDHNQCDASLGIWVKILPDVEINELFSPNEDGNNDYFSPVSRGNLKIQRLRIFNRWGQVVYESYDLNPRWDGKFHGTDQPQGTYVYQLDYLKDSKIETKTSGLTLIR